ncbi:PIN domain-containing protein [Streptomyces sp. NPDC057927]
MTDEETSEVPSSDDPRERGIFDGFSGYTTPTEDDWKNVLSDGLIVVDTNVLLNLYRYNQDARSSLLATLQKFDTRLWVPHQVMDEFWRNRESALEDPEKQLQQSISALRSGLEKPISDLRHWINRVSLDRASAFQLESKLTSALEDVIGSMEGVVDSSGIEMEADTSKDAVVANLTALLQGKIGGPLDVKDHDAAIIEGKRRIEKEVPPGYKDKKKQSRGDDTEVGDYLVWLQLIHEAKLRVKDVLLVTGDTKEDWWRTRNRIPLGPRNELAEELLREAGVRLYMLKPDRLLTYARDFLQVAVSEDSVQNVEMVNAQSESDELFRHLERLAESNTAHAVVSTWVEVEKALRRTLPDDPLQHRRTTAMQMIGELAQQGLISQEMARSAKELNQLRNHIAHTGESELTQEGALSFVSTARNLIEALAVAATPQAQGLRFEKAIIDLIRVAGFEITSADLLADQGYSFRVAHRSQPESFVAIQVKYYSSGSFGAKNLELQQERLSSLPGNVTSMLVVTNAPVADTVQAFNASAIGESPFMLGGRRYMEVVQWRNSDDDHLVVRALMRSML